MGKVKSYTIQDAVKLALSDLDTDNEFKIKGASPMQVDAYLEKELGMIFEHAEYDSPDDRVCYIYTDREKGVAIAFEWNGWAQYMSVSGYTLKFLDLD